MNNLNTPQNDYRPRHRGHNQVLIGGVIILIGMAILLRRMHLPLPDWMFGWEMILIVIGVITGIQNKFRDISWIIPIIIGLAFLVDDIFPGLPLRRFIWPLGVIAVGAIIAFRPQFGRWSDSQPEISGSNASSADSYRSPSTSDPSFTATSDDVLDATAVFGGVKRSVVSKQFQGGEVVAVFGGAEINLAHADFHGVIKLEIVNVLGGTKLIVPANWDVQSVMVAVFGGVEDKRVIRPEMIDPNKKLIIEGTSFLGGLEIRSY